VSDDLYDGVVPGEHPFNVGMSKPDFGAVISLYRILDIPEDNRLECFQSVVMHEVGHVFGAVDRETNVVERLGKHCANVCVMRPGSYKVVKHWTMITCDRQQHGAFCPECLVGLRAFFSDSLCGP
jgi:predicted Zn-dependent protease